jgi:hypothetical protein
VRLGSGSNDPQKYREFLTTGQYQARSQDERVRAAQLIDSGGPQVKSAARIALEGPADLLDQFMQVGQYKAQRQDFLGATHTAQIEQLIADAAGIAATAQKNAANAHKAAALAAKAAKEAADWAKKADASAKQAQGYADQAATSAKDSGLRRPGSRLRPHRPQGGRLRHQAASDAAASAVDAAQWAQASATAAHTAGDQARASAIAAGKDYNAAEQAFKDAFQAAVEKKEAERKAAEKDTGSQAEARYRCGILGCDAVEPPAHWCQHNETLSGILARGPAVEAAAKQLWDVEKDLLGLGQLDACRGGNVIACTELGEDILLQSKFKYLERGLEALEDLRYQRYFHPNCTQCFPAGTKVLMAKADTKNIETIHPGDTVLATDPLTGHTAARKVGRLIITDGDKHFDELTIATPDGPRKLTATYEHPFWSPSAHRWVKARDLTPGATLLSTNGATIGVQTNRAFDQHTRTYNLTVDDVHTYYVVAGETPVLVHNASPCAIKDIWHPGNFETPEASFEWHYAQRHGARAGVTREQYLQDAKGWAERLAQPGGKVGLNAKRLPIGDNGEFGVKYVDPQTGMGGILGPDGRVVSFWYSAEDDG